MRRASPTAALDTPRCEPIRSKSRRLCRVADGLRPAVRGGPSARQRNQESASESMTRRLILASLLLLSLPVAVFAQQSDLADVVAKTKFTPDDTFKISTFLETQARKLNNAKNDRARLEVKTAVLKWIQDPTATAEFKNVYAIEFSKAFRGLIGAQSRDTGFTAVMMLAEMPVPGARDGFVAALASPNAEVRYWGAKGIVLIKARVTKPAEYGPILTALGSAGASEAEPLVLKEIYAALDFTGVENFAGQADIASALNSIFDARLPALQAGGKRSEIDRPAFALAAKIYPKLASNVAVQREVVLNLARFLAIDVARYAQLGPKGGGIALADNAKACESALAAIVSDGGGTAPAEAQRVGALIAAAAEPKAVRAALDLWIGNSTAPGVLNGAPWNLNVGLAQ